MAQFQYAAALEAVEAKTDAAPRPRAPLHRLAARILAAWRRRRTRALLRRLDEVQLDDIGLARGGAQRDRWLR